MSARIITLTTDFGTQDGYVAAMKGVILGICPEATLVDISHEIPPQDIRAGAFVLAGAAPYFPAGTIHLAVVDPGVGSDRRPVVVQTARALYVGPDNGLFDRCLRAEGWVGAFELANAAFRRPEVSCTFHGRDVFAPAAAHLARGLDPRDLGPPVRDLVGLEIPDPIDRGDSVEGLVVHVDRFGNLITNLEPRHLPAEPIVRIEGRAVGGIVRAYADAPPGAPLAIWGSAGTLEISVRDGSACERFGVGRGARVVVSTRREVDDAPPIR